MAVGLASSIVSGVIDDDTSVLDTVVAPEYLSLRRQNYSRSMTKVGRKLGTILALGRNFDNARTFDNEDLESSRIMDH